MNVWWQFKYIRLQLDRQRDLNKKDVQKTQKKKRFWEGFLNRCLKTAYGKEQIKGVQNLFLKLCITSGEDPALRSMGNIIKMGQNIISKKVIQST